MSTATQVEHVDVVVVGAGISGIGAARYLRVEHPTRSVVVLEARETSGGTWDLFKYPGIRSDSDLHTFGYDFKPWTDRESIASAPKILDYLREAASESGVEALIRYRSKVHGASWSTEDARWTLDVERTDTGERFAMTASWIFCAGGYYRYDEGYTPEFPGRERFAGQVVHPQHWPEDLDTTGKRVVVIGSGATAATIVPALAETAAHVTMLQRTPTYVMPVPRHDPVAALLQKAFSPERAFALTRRKNIATQRAVYRFCQKYPTAARKVIRQINVRSLPEGYPVDVHFKPPYGPWDQRMCAVPDGDLFKALRKEQASIVTDRIATFTETGIQLESGEHLEADVIVTATGLNLQLLGGMSLTVDGRTVDYADTFVYRGLMLSGVPNFALAIGYTNSSWTLKVGLLCEYFCALLRHMDAEGADTAWAEADPDMPSRPLLDFGAGYVQRSLAGLPKQGPAAPWVMSMSYHEDRRLLRGDVVDDALHLSSPATRSAGVRAVA
ncbi:MAG: Baeyer-Villiger monooxygenase [Frankiales bacterium]|nr:Baeyer-Villiger monooxygenase [Frankiales bacterium]